MTSHLSAIRGCYPNNLVAHHFSQIHSLTDFRFTGIDRLVGDYSPELFQSKRRQLEAHYIKRTGSLAPLGLNRLQDISNKRVVTLALPFDSHTPAISRQIRSILNDVVPSHIEVRSSYTRSQNLKEFLSPSNLRT